MTPARLPRSILKASRKELDLRLNVTEGQLPTDMTGHAFIVAPVGTVDSGGLPYAGTNEAGTPVFNGDAMIHRLDFDRPGEVHLKSRLAKTPCFYADQASTTDPKFEALKFKNHGLTRLAMPLGPRNMVNTAFVPIIEPEVPNRLLVTYDAGRPYEVDPGSLELVTAVGYIDEWRNFLPADFEGPLPYILSTAHPYFDPHQKEFIAVNYGKSLENLLCSIPFLAATEADIKELEQILDRIAKFVEGRDYHPELLEQVRKALGELCGESPVDGNPSGCLDQVKALIGLETGPATGLHPELHSHLTSLKKKIDSILPPDFLGFANFVYLITWNTEGNFNRWQIMDEAGQPVAIHQTMHQIQVTKKYVIVMDTAFKFDFDQLFTNPFPENKGIERLLRKLVTGPQAPVSTMYIVDRADLVNGQQPHNYPDKKNEFKDVPKVTAKKLIVPLEAIHFLANYDGPNEDEIILYLAHNSADCVAEWLREYDTVAFRDDQPVPIDLVGMVVDPADIGHLGRYIIDGKNGALLSSKVIGQPGAPPGQDPDIPHTWGLGLYTFRSLSPDGQPVTQLKNIYWQSIGLWEELLTTFVCDLYKTYPYRTVALEALQKYVSQGKRANLFRLKTESMEIADYFPVPENCMLFSPQFVPRARPNGLPDGVDPTTDGYLVCPVFIGESGNQFWIFDAADLSSVRCKLDAPGLNFGFTMHTSWLPAIADRQAGYQVPVREDYGPRIAAMRTRTAKERELKALTETLFETEIYPHFGDSVTNKE